MNRLMSLCHRYRRIVSVIVLALFLGTTVLRPVPAQAAIPVFDPKEWEAWFEEKLEWAKNHAYLGQIIGAIVSLIQLTQKGFGVLTDSIDKLITLEIFSDYIKDQKEAEYQNNRTEVDWWLLQIQDAAKRAERNAPTPAAVVQICLDQKSKDVRRHVAAYESNLAGRLLRGYEMQERELGDGTGPAYSGNVAYFRKTAGAVNKADKPKDPKASRFADKEADLDISAEILRASIHKEPLEEPPMESKQTAPNVTVEVPKFDDGIEGQRMFRYARDYCYNLAGPTPTPPQGPAAESDAGRTKWAVYTQCKAIKSQFVKQCMDRIAYLSRPNAKRVPEVAAELVKQCKARMDQANLKPFLKVFANCEKPFSPFQADYLAVTACVNPKYYQVLAASGRTPAQMMIDSDQCRDRIMDWELRLAQEDAKLNEAAQGILAVKDCWAGMR